MKFISGILQSVLFSTTLLTQTQAPGGSVDIVKSGVLKDVDAFFWMHVLTNFPVGHIRILLNGAASTTSDEFTLSIISKGSHGSMPQVGTDPIVIGAETVNTLETIDSRNVTPRGLTVITVGQFQSGNAPNAIADKAELAATIRTITDSTRKLVEGRIKSLIDNITKTDGATDENPLYNGVKTQVQIILDCLQ